MLQKVAVLQVLRKCPAFYGIKEFYFLACNSSPLEFILSQMRPIYLSIYLSIYLWLYSRLLGFDGFFSFLIINTPLVILLGQGTSQSQGRYLHTEQHKHRINAHRHQCLKWNSNPRS
jgi:hypothetical protein